MREPSELELTDLERLRSRVWDRPDHQLELEESLMRSISDRASRGFWARHALLVALLTLLAGSIVGASVVLVGGLTFTFTDLEDGRTQMTVTDETGAVVDSQTLEADQGVFMIESGDGVEPGSYLIVEPVEEPEDDGAEDDGAAPPPATEPGTEP